MQWKDDVQYQTDDHNSDPDKNMYRSLVEVVGGARDTEENNGADDIRRYRH